MTTDRQCPSCGGFCKKSGCERENVQPEQRSEQWWRHEVSNAWAEGYEKGRASVKQPEQEPVAWMHIEEGELIAFEDDKNIAEQCEYCVPLYTAPPQRDEAPAKAVEWQGLTDEEKLTIVRETDNPVDALAATEAKLRKKNT